MSKYGQVYETGGVAPLNRAWRGILHDDARDEVWRDKASPDPDTAFNRMVKQAGDDYTDLRRWSGKLTPRERDALT